MKPGAEAHGAEGWWLRGTYMWCTCGYNPKDNEKMYAHWAQYGFKIVDHHGRLVREPVVGEGP